VGLGVVLTLNHRRLERDNDEWVEMEVQVPEVKAGKEAEDQA